MNRRNFTGTAAGAVAALALPTIPRLLPGSGVARFYLSSEYVEWDGAVIPGLELGATGMLILRLSLDPGGPSTIQVGHYVHDYGPEVPLTPAMLAAILEAASVKDKYGGTVLHFIDPKDAPSWLDPYDD